MTSSHLVFLRFSIIGLANTVIHGAVALALIEGYFFSSDCLLFNPVLANGIGFITATAFSYVANTYWSFSASITAENFLRFATVSVAGLVVSMFLAYFASRLSISSAGGVFIVVIFVPIINFLAHWRWTYKST